MSTPSDQETGKALEQELLELEEKGTRSTAGKLKLLVSIVAIAMTCFQFYTAGFGILEPMKQRLLHITFALVLIFLLYPASKKNRGKPTGWCDYCLALVSIYPLVHVLINYKRITDRIEYYSPIALSDYIAAILLIVLILEATRRTVGLSIVVVALVAIAYAFFGGSIPGIFAHKGVPLKHFIDNQFMTMGGIYNTPIAVSSTYVFVFILFGAFLVKTGGGQVIIDLAKAAAGRSKGGPAKMAILSSCLFGTINGSSVANVVTTGTYTIPLMKNMGYSKNFSGAVEAVASTGGQIMPPVMGAVAFLMAEMTNIPYASIIKAALLPALLYYGALLAMTHLEACRLDLPVMGKDDALRVKDILKNGAILFIPALILIYLLVSGASPNKAGFYSVVSIVLVGFIRKKDRLTFKKVLEAFEDAAKGAVSIVVTCATAGMVIGVVTIVGVGVKFASSIMTVSNGVLIIALFMVMLISIVLGMGLPTTAAYVITASVAVPSLISLNVSRLAANLFALYFACLSAITPPAAVAAYAAAGLSGGDANKTGWAAMKLGIAGFIVPYLFVYGSPLLLEGTLLEILVTVVTASVGVLAIAVGTQGWLFRNLNLPLRLLYFGSGVLLTMPGYLTDAIGLGFTLLLTVYLKSTAKKTAVGEK